MLSKRALEDQLAILGLRAGDTVMVHASLRKLGPVEGGADGLIAACKGVIGKQGTMLMVLGSRDGEIFEAEKSPADEDMGVLAEQFRQYPGVIVNNHPASRFAALGDGALNLLNPVPLHDYYGPGSVLERFVAADGKVLRLGANPDTTTVTHYAEYLARVSPKKRVTRRYVTKADGELFISSLDDSLGIQTWPKGDYFGQIMLDYLAGGRAAQAPVGNCTADLIDAKPFLAFAVSWMEKNLETSG